MGNYTTHTDSDLKSPDYTGYKAVYPPADTKDSYENNSDDEALDFDDPDDATCVVIGIDFGTTYSGAAWALSSKPNDVHIITSWPSTQSANTTLEKVPSKLTYDKSGAVSSWGYALNPDSKPLSWFKLLLSSDGQKKLSAGQPETLDLLNYFKKDRNKTDVDIVADYLKVLWEHVLGDVSARFDRLVWEELKIKVVLTIPAMWDHKAQELTRSAAVKAGLTTGGGKVKNFMMIGEPEAAALEVFNSTADQGRTALNVDSDFVVVDAGGGTVDLISYKIAALEPLSLTMTAEPSGGLCGAVFLDAAFKTQIRKVISNQEYDNIGSRALAIMMDSWEYGAKRSYGARQIEGLKFHVVIPGYTPPPAYPAQSSTLTTSSPSPFRLGLRNHIVNRPSSTYSSNTSGVVFLENEQLNTIFDEVESQINDLVEEQVEAVKTKDSTESAKVILLVGGFGANLHLKKQLETRFPNLEIRQPVNAWTAICRGAVLRGLGNDMVKNHISKYNYGITQWTTWNDKLHEGYKKVWDDVTEQWRADEVMSWFLKRGDNIVKTDPVIKKFTFSRRTKEDLNHGSISIHCSRTKIAEGKKTTEVKFLCKLHIQVDQNLWDDLTVKTAKSGKEYRHFGFDVEAQVSSGQLKWRVLGKDGKALGSAKIKVKYE